MLHIIAEGRQPALVAANYVYRAGNDEERYVMERLHGAPVVLNAREYDVYVDMVTALQV